MHLAISVTSYVVYSNLHIGDWVFITREGYVYHCGIELERGPFSNANHTQW